MLVSVAMPRIAQPDAAQLRRMRIAIDDGITGVGFNQRFGITKTRFAEIVHRASKPRVSRQPRAKGPEATDRLEPWRTDDRCPFAPGGRSATAWRLRREERLVACVDELVEVLRMLTSEAEAERRAA